MSKRASIFSAIALGTAIVAGAGAPAPAQAEDPVSACNQNLIQDVFNTSRGQVAFGRDGCVYNIVMGNPLAVKNYDLENGRESQRFSSEYQRAAAAGQREAHRQQREAERRQTRCDRATDSAISRGLDALVRGRDIRITDATRALTQCVLQ